MADFENTNKRIAKNTVFLYTRMAITMLLSLYTTKIVLNTLGVDNFGIFNIVSGCVTMFTFINGALGASAGRFITFELGRKDMVALNKTFNASIIVHLVLALIIVILSETVGLWILDDKLIIPDNRMFAAKFSYQISILIVVINIMQVPFGALIVAHEKFGVFAFLALLDILMRLLLIFLLKILPGDKLILWSIMVMGSSLVYAVFNVIYCRKNFSETRIRPHKETKLYKKMLSFSSWNLVSGVSGMLQNQGLSIILNMFYGPTVIAARGVAYQVQGVLSQFSGNFTAATNPQIVKLYAAGELNKMTSLFYFSGCLAFYLSWIITLPLCLELKFVLHLWLGSYPHYTESFTILTLILGLVYSIKTSRTAVISATGKLKAINLSVCTILCLSFPIGYFCLWIGFAPYCIIIISIILTVIGEFVASIILDKYLKESDYSVKSYWRHVYGKCTIIAIVSSILPLFFHLWLREGVVRIVIVSIMSFCTVAFSVYYLGFSVENRHFFISFIRNKLFLAVKKLRGESINN